MKVGCAALSFHVNPENIGKAHNFCQVRPGDFLYFDLKERLKKRLHLYAREGIVMLDSWKIPETGCFSGKTLTRDDRRKRVASI